MHPAIDTIIQLFEERGGSEYGGEAVTQLQHALQCATLAKETGTEASLIAAALLHDIGHLMHDLPDDAPELGVDDIHEVAAAGFLERHFIPAVTQPVRLHVMAKRYLCSTDPGYLSLLSAPSVLSLGLQGGLLSSEEIAAFEKNEFAAAAVQLRKWDDVAKDAEAVSASLESFVPYLVVSLKQSKVLSRKS